MNLSVFFRKCLAAITILVITLPPAVHAESLQGAFPVFFVISETGGAEDVLQIFANTESVAQSFSDNCGFWGALTVGPVTEKSTQMYYSQLMMMASQGTLAEFQYEVEGPNTCRLTGILMALQAPW